MKSLIPVALLVAALGQVVPQVGVNHSLFFTIPTQDVNGGAETIASVEVAVAATGVDLNGAGVALRTQKGLAPSVGVSGFPLGVFLKDLPTGNYTLWIRTLDLSGNAAAWAAQNVAVDVIAPKTVTGIAIR